VRGSDVVALALISAVASPLVGVLVAWLRRQLGLAGTVAQEPSSGPPARDPLD